MAWTQYVKAFNDEDDLILRHQLFYSPDIEVRKALFRVLGGKLNRISVLLKEIETLAVQEEGETSSKGGLMLGRPQLPGDAIMQFWLAVLKADV